MFSVFPWEDCGLRVRRTVFGEQEATGLTSGYEGIIYPFSFSSVSTCLLCVLANTWDCPRVGNGIYHVVFACISQLSNGAEQISLCFLPSEGNVQLILRGNWLLGLHTELQEFRALGLSLPGCKGFLQSGLHLHFVASSSLLALKACRRKGFVVFLMASTFYVLS